MKKLLSTAVLLVAMAAFSMPAMAAEYKVTVNIDDSTGSDVDMMSTTMKAAAAGTDASKSLRKLAMGVAGEAQVQLDSRIDSNNVLTLDDGSQAALIDGDVVHVAFISKPGAVVNHNIVLSPTSGKEHRTRAVSITVLDQYGNVTRSMDVPPTKINSK